VDVIWNEDDAGIVEEYRVTWNAVERETGAGRCSSACDQ